MLLLLFPLLLFALPWVLPRRWLPACGLTVFYCATYLFIDDTRAQCTGCGGLGAALGSAIFTFACIGSLISFLTRLAVPIFSGKRKTEPGPSVFSSGATTALAAFGLACVVVWQAVVITKAWFDDGFWIHGALAVLALGWVALGRLYREERGEHGLRIFSGVGAVTTVCALAWSLQVPAKVIAAAEEAAAGAPYCLLTSGRNGLRPARDRMDLSGFAMQDGPVSLRHATLAVGESREPVWRYWSYRRGAFVPEFFGGVLTCELQRNGAKDLSWFQPKAEPLDSRFWLARGQWHIPAAYLGGARDRPPVLTFYAQGKDFEPFPVSGRKPGFDVGMINAQVQVTLCDIDRLHVWQAQNDSNFTVEPAGTEAGLQKQSVDSRGSPRREFQYVGLDKTGRISTWLLCHEGGDTCRHAFRREGVVVEFQHPRSQFAQWKEMQDAAWRRVKSLAVVWPDAPSQSCKS
ncbi:hypothetical protein SAMN05216350_102134 [Polaromonas sp. YR568]|uniref:hypothetical protein n=1 Tax=Polaromonas sp. YR568 TaxID=1855301 RepID=UPI0008F180B5|nr:hypothetical protein [Polaromonas sp. YR568]SFU48662.1 hypothetical protein SAMN05216350_102134 [Polaromonas sp. YR568]